MAMKTYRITFRDPKGNLGASQLNALTIRTALTLYAHENPQDEVVRVERVEAIGYTIKPLEEPEGPKETKGPKEPEESFTQLGHGVSYYCNCADCQRRRAMIYRPSETNRPNMTTLGPVLTKVSTTAGDRWDVVG